MGKGQELYQKAKELIPGGTMLLSKRPEMFLPDLWPAYYSKAKGCSVWDLDGVKYEDLSIMSVGTNSLGYAHDEIDAAVMKTVQSSNMTSLNCPEEVYLAEKLIDMHPWADMARFARSGGEANAIAVRIARAASGKDHVAICGYHGWHDWYISTNLNNGDGLADHLLPGLEANGVPKHLKNTVHPFDYNHFEGLEKIATEFELGVIIMEVSRNKGPENNFLQKVRKLATEKGIVLIFDECTSGFRQTFGGLHLQYGVEPDLAMFGKALGNGYAITAVIGRRSVMEAAQKTFISSTFWTERIGPSAALKTLEVMEREKSWLTITETGKTIAKNWQKLADDHRIPISLSGLPALIGFNFESSKAQEYKTYMTQEMLLYGYLAVNNVYVCTAHTSEVLEAYFEKLDLVFQVLGKCECDELDIHKLLKTSVAHTGLKELTGKI